ncbi:hypothetical protein AAE478_010076 [Parahypoxylon ruwenzoriense]
MFIPTVLPYITQFYPIGNTPAVSLTRGLPQGVDADILLLGCGDVRNILFTAYSEQGFPRNILLFTTLIDGISADSAWDIYFHLRIGDGSKKLVKTQARKLSALSDDIEGWNGGQYGSVLTFCDANSLQQVRQVWMKYALSQSESETSFDEGLQRSRRFVKAIYGKSEGQLTITGLRSAAPLSLASTSEISLAFEYFWKHGSFSKPPVTSPNPLFAESMSINTNLHYGTDPILGFHLATAFAKLAPASPLNPNQDDSADGIPNVVRAAEAQFREWVAAFQKIPTSRITLRFTVSDCLSFSYALQSIWSLEGRPTSLFRRHLDTTPIELDPKVYNAANPAPARFDVIDTSNLADHLGALNILIAAAPLLKMSESSTLWTETLLKKEKTRKRQFDTLLCGHAPTISMLVGLAPVDYWTNATSVSCIDELIMNSMLSTGYEQQAHSRLAWKLGRSFSQQAPDSGTLFIEPQALAKVIFRIYVKMFENEDGMSLLNLDRDELPDRLRSTSYPLFHRGSFAALLKRIQANITTDWPSFWKQLLGMVDEDSQDTTTIRSLYRQELAVQLHLQGVYTENWLRGEMIGRPRAGGFNSWRNIPEVVCLTVAVPRQQIDRLYSTDMTKLNSPTLEGLLKSSNPFGWQNCFANVHVAFGHVDTSGDREADDFSITVRPDPLGWQGNSPLVASYYVPSSMLQAEPNDAKVGLNVQNTVMNTGTYGHLLPTMTVYMTEISDTSHVFITKYEAGMSSHPFTGGQIRPTAGSIQDYPSTATRITANLEENEIQSLCSHIDFLTQQGKTLLTERVPIELRQSSPFSIDIVFGKKILVHHVSFPVPVLTEAARTRIARTSGYIEVIAPLADPLTSGLLSSFMYPATLGKESIPVLLSSQHVNLDSLPILNVDQAFKKANQWLNTLTSHQFSVRERQLRDSGKSNEGMSSSLRVNFKESLFTMFMLASGLQGGQTGLFALEHPTNGNQVLIFIRAIRLNGAEGSIVADAAVIPLTRQLVGSGDLGLFLLVLRELEICVVHVDDEELILWKNALPVFAERCRTWSHGSACEYKKSGATIPLSTELGEQFMCSCGNGRLPEHFVSLPEWDEQVSKHAVRIAISPTFAAPFVEDIIDLDFLRAQGSLTKLQMDKCRSCNATESKNGGQLMKCSRCREVSYCSQECQRKDWKKHRMECSPNDM